MACILLLMNGAGPDSIYSRGTLIHRLKHLIFMINNIFLKITGPTQFKDSSWQQ